MLVYCAFCLELISTYFALEGKGAPIVLWITQSIFSFKRKGQVLSCIKRGGGHLIVFLKSTNTLKSYILVKPVRSNILSLIYIIQTKCPASQQPSLILLLQSKILPYSIAESKQFRSKDQDVWCQQSQKVDQEASILPVEPGMRCGLSTAIWPYASLLC